MGRKIPGRKHRGVKDPEKQRAERFAKIKDKINSGPANPDDQQIPKSLSRLIELKNKVKKGLFNKKKDNNREGTNKRKPFKGRPEKPIPKFEQLPGESNREFKSRMNRICSEAVREAAFEDKYNIDIRRNEDGEVEGVVKRPKDELELLVKKLQKEKTAKKNKKGKKKVASKNDQPRLTKSQKWSLKKSEKRKKKESEKDKDHRFMPQKEQVKFGEIVHAPPNLIAPRKVQKLGGAPRPGQKQLLLKSMLSNETSTNAYKQGPKKDSLSTLSKSINKKGKRKDLPNALRRQLDNQQKEIIEAYKSLKLQKYAA